MLQHALQKLQKEIGDNSKDPYIPYLGGELIKHIRSNPDQAELFMVEGKSITGSLDALYKVAEKRRVGNRAAINPDEVKAIVLEYFGVPRQPVEPEPVTAGFSVNLDDLL